MNKKDVELLNKDIKEAMTKIAEKHKLVYLHGTSRYNETECNIRIRFVSNEKGNTTKDVRSNLKNEEYKLNFEKQSLFALPKEIKEKFIIGNKYSAIGSKYKNLTFLGSNNRGSKLLFQDVKGTLQIKTEYAVQQMEKL